jgi:predicted component of type VI protein secretion system
VNASPTRRRSDIGSVVSPAIRRIKAPIESSVRGRPISTKTVHGQVATHVSIPAMGSSGRSRRNTLPASPLSNTFTAAGKRKRLSADTVEEAVQPKSKTAIAPAKRRSTESAQPSTPPTSGGLHTPSSTPAKTPALTTSGSSVASTPLSTKAKAKAKVAGKKTRKIRTKYDYEERVTPERYREIMNERRANATAQGHESVPRGVTRSGRVRKMYT